MKRRNKLYKALNLSDRMIEVMLFVAGIWAYQTDDYELRDKVLIAVVIIAMTHAIALGTYGYRAMLRLAKQEDAGI